MPGKPLAAILLPGLLASLLAACSTPLPQAGLLYASAASSAPTDSTASAATPVGFADNPVVYFVLTDRFENGNPANDHAYGRQSAGPTDPGSFHGGDLAGLTKQLKAGYFKDLGVNALWISAPYEQIHGWVVGGNKSFKHYAYHGYYALDYTVLDKNMGTPDELRDMINTAHAQGIRVLFDVVMNHPGYADIQTLAELKIPILWKGHEKATLKDYHSFIDYNNFEFTKWWGGDWVRAGLPGYPNGGSDDMTSQLAYLPDFRTERPNPVELPPFLKTKADTRATLLPNTPVRGYLVKWLSDWVREYGVDGFRCDTVKHVEPESWIALKQASVAALADWKKAHPAEKIDDAPFWMTGEVWGHSVTRSNWFDAGFDSIINFDFQAKAGNNWKTLDGIYNGYASQLSKAPGFDVLSYISSHDTSLFARDQLRHGLSALLLAPGGVQLFYGDETGRQPGASPDGDAQQATRSDMNWGSIDQALLRHAQKLGKFRAAHVALARGEHLMLSEQPYVFARIDQRNNQRIGQGINPRPGQNPADKVVVAPDVSGEVSLPVGKVFADGVQVCDAYGGECARVANGSVKLKAQGMVLLSAASK